MDGRDLSPSIILKWIPEFSILGIANTIPIFIKNVLLANDYRFYGTFYINTVYDMKNFDNMLVVISLAKSIIILIVQIKIFLCFMEITVIFL